MKSKARLCRFLVTSTMACTLTLGCRGVTTTNSLTDATGLDSGERADAASGAFLTSAWSKRLGPGIANGAAYDPSGSLAVTGQIWGTFDPSVTSDALPDADVSCAEPSGRCFPDGFLATFDPHGRTRWTKRWDGSTVTINGLTVASNGHISVGISEFVRIDGGGTANQVATYDAMGALVWAWSVPGTSVLWLGADENSNVFVFTQDAILTKVEPSGTPIWSKKIGSLILNEGNPIALAVTGSGGVISLGHLFVGGDAGSAPSNGHVPPLILASFGSTGDLLWSRALQGTGALEVGAVATDPAGDILVGGSFNYSLDVGGAAPLIGPMGDSAAEPVFVAKYDSGGNYKWVKQYDATSVDPGGGGPQDDISAIAIDPAGDIFAAGHFGGALDLGKGPWRTSGNGARNLFVAELDRDGNTINAAQFGDGMAINDGAMGVVALWGNQIAVAGSFQGTIDFGDDPRVSQYNAPCQFGPCSDGFVATFRR